MCTSFWVGIVGFYLFLFGGIGLFPHIYVGGFIFGCVSSATSYFLCNFVDDDGIRMGREKIIVWRPKDERRK